jgi:integrase
MPAIIDQAGRPLNVDEADGINRRHNYVSGRPVRVSTGTEKRKEAEAFLKRREGAVVNGVPIPPRADRIRYEEIADDLRVYYETTGKRDPKEAEVRLAHLDRFFTQIRVLAITPDRITRYIQARQQEGAANATINRELVTISRMLRLAYKNGKVLRVPPIDKLTEADPRSGFFERDQYESVFRHLADDLQVAAAIAHTYGWRTQSEVLTRERRHLDLGEGTLRIDPGETKNKKGRIVYLTPDLKVLLTAQLARVEAIQKQTGRIIPYLFPHLRGRRQGARRKDYRKAWLTACKAAGVAGRHRHDFRRTAVRNMVNSGVVERVAMAVTGHKTRSVFDRYHIVTPEDLKDVARKLAGTFSGTLGASEASRPR